MTLAAKSAWVVGGAGFLGSALVELCCSAGWSALVVDPASSDSAWVGQGAAVPSLSGAALLPSPAVVFFCASTRGGDATAYRRAYLEPVLQALPLAPRARFVFCSSTSLYGAEGGVSESSPTPARSERHHALLSAEHAVLRSGGVVARLAALYGPGRCELLRRHLAGEPRLSGNPERMLNYVHVQDAARALFLLADARALQHGVYNICAESFTWRQAYALLEQLTGVHPSQAIAPAGRRGMADHRVLAERVRSELGWTPSIYFSDFVKDSLPLA